MIKMQNLNMINSTIYFPYPFPQPTPGLEPLEPIIIDPIYIDPIIKDPIATPIVG